MFSEKGGRECGREGWRKKRESNYSAGIIINSQLVPRNYSFEGHSWQGGRMKKKKRGRKRQFRWKINHSLLSLISQLLLFLPKEQIIQPTAVYAHRRGLASLFSWFSDHFFFYFFLPCFASRRSLSLFLRSALKLPKKYVSSNKTRYGRGRNTSEFQNARTMKNRREESYRTLEDQRGYKKNRKRSRNL